MAEKNRLTRLIISDPSAMMCKLIRDGLRRARFEVADCVVTSGDLVRSVQQQSIDVALISAQLRDGRMAGFRALQRVREVAPSVRTIMILDEKDPELVISSFRSGARGVLSRTEPFGNLCKLIRAVSEGQICATSTDVEAVIEALSQTAARRLPSIDPSRPLTRREQEVVLCVQQGYNNREIAQKLHVSEHTVKNHLFRIFEKLGVSNRVELVTCFQQPAVSAANHIATGIEKCA